MEVWFEHYAKVKVRPSSHQTYRGYIDNHIKPNIGKIPLEKLTSLELQKFTRSCWRRAGWIDWNPSTSPKGSAQDGAEHPSNHFLCHELAQEQKLISTNPADGCACQGWSTVRCRHYRWSNSSPF